MKFNNIYTLDIPGNLILREEVDELNKLKTLLFQDFIFDKLILNCLQTKHIGSRGLTVFIDISKLTQDRKIELELINVGERLKRALWVTNLEDVLNIKEG